MDPSTIGYPSYRPPKRTSAEIQRSTLRYLPGSNKNLYELRANDIENLIQTVNEIVSSVIGEGNERAKINKGDEESRQFLRNQDVEGRPFMISTSTSEAYRFLNRSSNFNGNTLNLEIVKRDIENLKRKALESRMTAQLFANIQSNEDFKRDPKEYIEQWRNTLNQPTAAERKVLKRFETLSTSSTVGFRVENPQEISPYSFCVLI